MSIFDALTFGAIGVIGASLIYITTDLLAERHVAKETSRED